MQFITSEQAAIFSNSSQSPHILKMPDGNPVAAEHPYLLMCFRWERTRATTLHVYCAENDTCDENLPK